MLAAESSGSILGAIRFIISGWEGGRGGEGGGREIRSSRAFILKVRTPEFDFCLRLSVIVGTSIIKMV